MNTLSHLLPRLRAPISSLPLRGNPISLSTQRAYVHDSPQNFSQANAHDAQEECNIDNTPNHPIPSNKAHPTLRDGRQSNLSDMEGKRHEDLPEDVRRHNEQMEHRYDRPYNHTGDQGKIEKAFKDG